jgi:hypothetical protein
MEQPIRRLRSYMEAKVGPVNAWHVHRNSCCCAALYVALAMSHCLSLPQGWWSQEKEDEARSAYRLPPLIHTEISKCLIALSSFIFAVCPFTCAEPLF